jgi:hypothetical protein
MGWERGYYYRVRKVSGRVVREYVGGGAIGELCAELDEIERQERGRKRRYQKKERDKIEALKKQLDGLEAVADLAARAALLAAGFRKHKRGEWRRRRAQGAETH